MRAKGQNALLLCVLMIFAGPAYGISKGKPVAENDPIRILAVSVYSDTDDCTGVKVAANFVLTARHCRVDNSTRIVFADGSSYKIVQHFVPDGKAANNEAEHDLALVKIDGRVPGPVAEIADEANTPTNGSIGWTAGYGGEQITKKHNPLRKLAVTMLDRDYSSTVIAVRTIRNGAVCDGDSGGPGYTQYNDRIVLWGIDSAGMHGDSKCASIELYAKVSSAYEWIKTIIAADSLEVSRRE